MNSNEYKFVLANYYIELINKAYADNLINTLDKHSASQPIAICFTKTLPYPPKYSSDGCSCVLLKNGIPIAYYYSRFYNNPTNHTISECRDFDFISLTCNAIDNVIILKYTKTFLDLVFKFEIKTIRIAHSSKTRLEKINLYYLKKYGFKVEKSEDQYKYMFPNMEGLYDETPCYLYSISK